MQLECLPYGVGQREEGICLLLRMGPYRILLDCGLSNLAALITTPPLMISSVTSLTQPADVVLCSHAHPDHARALLSLHRAFPRLPIYASEATLQLLPLNWPGIKEEEVTQLGQALPWRSPIEFFDGLTVELWPAGHLPGATAFLLSYTPPRQTGYSRPYTVFYTGDFFLSNTRLVEGFPLEELRGLKPDVLIVEGSYGTARHPRRRQQENQLAEQVNQCLAAGESVLFPVPMLGLGQDLLMLFRSHHHFTGREIDIWVDGRVAQGCDAYLALLPYLPSSVQNFARHQPLFWDERVRPQVRRLTPEQRPSLGQTPCIVLTDGAIDLREYGRQQDHPWVVFLPQQPDQAEQILTQPSPFPIEPYLLADHCDGAGTTQLIHNLRPQHVVFIHGSPAYLTDLASLDELNSRYHLHSPPAGVWVDLPIGETFLQPAAPDTHYEGEVVESDALVAVMLSDAITTDPRWQNLADTGLVAVRWQGDELVVRGVSQRELLNRGHDRPTSSTISCCATCHYCRNQRCWNQASPLYNFKVSPEGYCPAFEPSVDSD